MAHTKVHGIAMLVTGFVVAGICGFAAGGYAGGFLQHGMPFGHGAGMHCMADQLIDELGLDSEQQQRLDNAHQVLQSHFEGRIESHGEHYQWLLDAIEQGNVDQQEVREAIDSHLEEARTLAYAVSDELVPLVNSLDETQRATLLEHINRAHETMARMHGGDKATGWHSLHGDG